MSDPGLTTAVVPPAPALEERPPLNRRWQRGVGLGALAFCAIVFVGLIVASLIYPINDIMKSALWWAGFLGSTIVISWALRLDERLPTGWWSRP